MNAIKNATLGRFYYETREQLRGSLSDFVVAHNFAGRPKTLNGLTSYEPTARDAVPNPNGLPSARSAKCRHFVSSQVASLRI